jgi:hypothetical protein
MNLAKLIGCVVAIILFVAILRALLPYVVIILAVCGAYCLYQTYHLKN